VLSYLRQLPIGAWAGFVIIGLGVWARDIFGVVVGGILAVVTLIATDRKQEQENAAPPGQEPEIEERFKDL
jgi:hypothetical protein